MNSLVLGLQNEITRSGCDVVNVLRKAHLISSKLDLAQFDQWTQYELNGYPGPGYCPEYRKVRGVLKALNPYRGWIPTVIQNDDFEKKICERKIVNSISEIISLGKSSDDGWLICEFSGEQLEYLNSLFKPPVPMTYKLYIPSTSIADIEEKVKNTILDWTLKLEAEGIVGENMVFSEKEKNCAAGIPQTINNFMERLNATTVFEGKKCLCHNDFSCNHLLLDGNNRLTGIIDFGDSGIIDEYCDFIYLLEDSEEEIGTNFGEDILRMYGNIDIEKAKEYQDIVEEYYPIETIVYGIKNIKQEFIENGRKEIYKRTYKD